MLDLRQSDSRRYPRYVCEGYAEVFVPQGALLFQGRMLDLSFSGCFIKTSILDLERGTPVEVPSLFAVFSCALPAMSR